MKVFLYTPFYPPQSQAAAIRCFWLAKTLKNAGHEVLIESSIQSSDSSKLFFNPADNKQSFIKRLVFEIFAGVELFLKILFSNHDLYILSSPPFVAISIAHLACRLKGQKYVIDVRDIYPDVYFAQGLIKENSFPGMLAKSFTRKMYNNAFGITSVTPGLVAKIKMLSPAAEVKLLINGYDKELFKPSSSKFANFTVIFHGNMGKIQNLPVILKIAKKLENQSIDFVFIGEGPQAELLKSKISSNVKYLGSKNYNEIPEIISKAHMGISARRDDEIGSDAFPVKVFEYVGVGIPVIITPKMGVMTELVESGIYEFDNNDIDGMAEKILDIKKSGETIKLKDDLSRQGVSKKILDFCDFN